MSFPVYTICEIIHQLADHAQHSNQHDLGYRADEALVSEGTCIKGILSQLMIVTNLNVAASLAVNSRYTEPFLCHMGGQHIS